MTGIYLMLNRKEHSADARPAGQLNEQVQPELVDSKEK